MSLETEALCKMSDELAVAKDRIEALKRERHDLSEEMMRAVIASHDVTGTKRIWSDVVHGWAARLAAALREAEEVKT